MNVCVYMTGSITGSLSSGSSPLKQNSVPLRHITSPLMTIGSGGVITRGSSGVVGQSQRGREGKRDRVKGIHSHNIEVNGSSGSSYLYANNDNGSSQLWNSSSLLRARLRACALPEFYFCVVICLIRGGFCCTLFSLWRSLCFY